MVYLLDRIFKISCQARNKGTSKLLKFIKDQSKHIHFNSEKDNCIK